MILIRSRPLSVCVALFALAFGLWSCAGSSGGKTSTSHGPQVWKPGKPDPSGPVVAIVAGRRITKHDVDSVLALVPATIREEYLEDPGQYKQLVDRYVQQEAIFLAAKDAGTEKDPEYLADVEAQKRQLLLKRYYLKAVKSLPAIPDSAVRLYYEAHASEFMAPGRARVRHIQVPAQARALEVIRKLRTVAWDNVASQYSTDKVTAKSGGVLGFVTSDAGGVPGVGNAPSIVAAAFKLKEGETSAPLKSPRGWHVIRVDERTEAGPQPLVNVQQQIRSQLEGEQSERFQQTLMDSLRRTYGVVVFEDSIKAAMKPVLSPAELFGKAQASSAPPERIELFKELITRYPNDKSAAQAAFMIGFTYAEELKDYPAARLAFEEFIRKYPQSDLVGSAKWMLQNMEHPGAPPSVGSPDSMRINTLPGGIPGGTNSKP